MQKESFKALVLRSADGETVSDIETLSLSDLPERDLIVRVTASSLNYKDGLAITGRGPVVRSFPMVPGIDLAGTVEQSRSDSFRIGDEIIVTGWGMGERHWGGFAERAAVAADWATPLPEGMDARQAMAFGTAGLTAMLCVGGLERHGIDKAKPVLVTGAAGGVGSIAVALLARLGYRVVASTGRTAQASYLAGLGATEIVDREEVAGASKPLLSERWGGVVDTVGGRTLAGALAATAYGGAVSACGLAGGGELKTTVMPFILRGVSLIGIDSVNCPSHTRIDAWHRLGQVFPEGLPAEMVEYVGLAELPGKAHEIIDGQVRGRLVVEVS